MLILWLICNEIKLLATVNAPLIHPLMYGGIGGHTGGLPAQHSDGEYP